MERIAIWLLRLAPSLMEWGAMLLPLTIYLLWLGFSVGRSKKPVIIEGKRDTLLLALALSGFFLLGPPTWLLDRYSRHGWTTYVMAYAFYLFILGFLLWAWVAYRRPSLVVYSINPELFPARMRQILDETGVPYQVTPGRVAIGGNRLVLDLDASAAFYCITIRWTGEQDIWKEVEPRLRESLQQVETTDNPSGSLMALWGGLSLLFVTLSATIFGWYCAFMWF